MSDHDVSAPSEALIDEEAEERFDDESPAPEPNPNVIPPPIDPDLSPEQPNDEA